MKLYDGIWMHMKGYGVYEPMWMYMRVYDGL